MTDFAQARRVTRSRPWWKKVKTWVTVIVVVIVVCGVSLLYYRSALAALYDHAIKGKTDFESAKTQVQQQKYGDAAVSMRSAAEQFGQAHTAAGKLGGLRVVPLIGRQVKAVDNLLQVGVQAGTAAASLIDVANAITAPLQRDANTNFASISVAEKRKILEGVAQGQPEIQGAKAQMDLAMQYLDEIPEKGLVGPLASAIKPLREQIPQIDNVLNKAIPAVQVLPAILGYPDQRSYLFLLQNNTELRPTGGFIGTYGVVQFSNADINSFTTHNVYALDNPAENTINIDPPAPLKQYLAANHWFFRDSNWSPDFPTSAQEALRFYNLETGTTGAFHGVIAVTPTFISDLMRITGDIKIGGTTYTPDNLVDVLEYSVEKGYVAQGASDADRKQIIGDLADELFRRILTLPHSKWPDLWGTLANNVDEKQILMYMQDHNEEQFLQDLGWAGEVKTADDDYIMIVDANLASLKSDPGVKRSIEYSVVPDGQNLKATLIMHYNNEGTFNWKSTRYRTYVRFYVPQGSTLLSSSGFLTNDKLHNGKPTDPTVSEELGKTVIGGFTSIEPQATGDITLNYTLPSGITDKLQNGSYSLLVQKQPGTEAYGLSLDITAEKSIQSYSPADQGKVEGKKVHFATDLRQDRYFSTSVRP